MSSSKISKGSSNVFVGVGNGAETLTGNKNCFVGSYSTQSEVGATRLAVGVSGVTSVGDRSALAAGGANPPILADQILLGRDCVPTDTVGQLCIQSPTAAGGAPAASDAHIVIGYNGAKYRVHLTAIP